VPPFFVRTIQTARLPVKSARSDGAITLGTFVSVDGLQGSNHIDVDTKLDNDVVIS